jgi:hypothetical protein
MVSYNCPTLNPAKVGSTRKTLNSFSLLSGLVRAMTVIRRAFDPPLI